MADRSLIYLTPVGAFPVLSPKLLPRGFERLLSVGMLSLSVVVPFILLKRTHSRKLIRIDAAQG